MVTGAASYLGRRASSVVIGGSSDDVKEWIDPSEPEDSPLLARMHLPKNFFDLPCHDAKGSPFKLETLRGKPTLVVNVASA